MQSLITGSLSLDHPSVTFADACGILGALSNVKNMELLFPCDVAGKSSLQSDMQSCRVVFSNLTTLSLSDWCLHGNCKALLYFLEHSPNLEELTLKMRKLGFHDHLDWFPTAAAAGTDSPCKETEKTFDCNKLKKIEIICPKHDKRVGMLVAILLAKIISSPEISIKPF
ncbi:hypothetical protein C2845_PM13G03130 [Panicum miliaceum]|uniref:FBD domain-containing protein n=1 Tax=Panicum miliaceum TaxID=4540 RepID=A0A3L6RM12_PANMI|nr:hypothetical protein C2845_PM13G03130 [Panicum miliaceum]